MVRNGPRIPLRLQSLFVAAATGKPEPEVQSVMKTSKQAYTAFESSAATSQQVRHKQETCPSPRKQSRTTPSTAASSPQKTSRRQSAPRRTSSEPQRQSSPRKSSKRHASLRSSPTKRSSRRASLKRSIPTITPQDYLDGLMLNRGYSIERFDVPFYPPTPLQLVSHTAFVVEAAKRDPEKLRSLMEAGLSPNCCNSHGDALLNMVCRRSLTETLRVLIDCGARFDVSAGDGLTPLHEACWNSPPNFPLVDIILRHAGFDVFHIKDKKGFVPLQYASIDDWDAWLRYLESRKGVYWPIEGRQARNPEETGCRIEPLPIEVADAVAKGHIKPEDVWMFMDDGEESSTTSCVTSGTETSWDSDDSSGSESYSSTCSYE